MKISFADEGEFAVFKKQLKSALLTGKVRHFEVGDRTPAAVLILLFQKDGELHVLLTKRSEKLRNHSGQISFPGGKIEKQDLSPEAAALRETFEETGITSSALEKAGRFNDYVTTSGFHISSFIAFAEEPECVPAGDEVDEYLKVPMEIFVKEKYSSKSTTVLEGVEVPTWHYPFQGKDIWGMTARALTELAQVIREGKCS